MIYNLNFVLPFVNRLRQKVTKPSFLPPLRTLSIPRELYWLPCTRSVISAQTDPMGGLSLLRTPFPLRGKTCSLHSHCNTLAAPLLSPHIFPKAQKKDA